MRRQTNIRNNRYTEGGSNSENGGASALGKKKRIDLPTIGDVVDIAWEDRDLVFTGVIHHQASKKKGRKPKLFEFEIHYSDGDQVIHDLDTMRWRFTSTKYWYHPGSLSDVKPKHVKHCNESFENKLVSSSRQRQQKQPSKKQTHLNNVVETTSIAARGGYNTDSDDDDDDNDGDAIEIKRRLQSSPRKRRRKLQSINANSKLEKDKNNLSNGLTGLVTELPLHQLSSSSPMPHDAVISPTSIARFDAVSISTPTTACASVSHSSVSDSSSCSNKVERRKNANNRGHAEANREQGRNEERWSSDAWSYLRDSQLPVRKRLSLSNISGLAT